MHFYHLTRKMFPLFFFAIARQKNCRIKLENCKEFAVLAVEHVLSLSELGSRILCVSDQQPMGSKYFWCSILIFLHITGGPCLMRISLVQISLLPFFKTFHRYLAYAFLGLFISLSHFFYLANAILGLFICLMQFYFPFILLLRSQARTLCSSSIL